jgi:ABC-type lipoprotein export system ATPase subunit
MIFKINNLGIIKTAHFDMAKFSLIGGSNGSGKSFLVKMVYAMILKSYSVFLKSHGMKENNSALFEEILSKNIRWIFQQHDLGTLVNNHFKEDVRGYELMKSKITNIINPFGKYYISLTI